MSCDATSAITCCLRLALTQLCTKAWDHEFVDVPKWVYRNTWKAQSVQTASLKQAVAKLASIYVCRTNNMSGQRTHVRQMRVHNPSTITRGHTYCPTEVHSNNICKPCVHLAAQSKELVTPESCAVEDNKPADWPMKCCHFSLDSCLQGTSCSW